MESIAKSDIFFTVSTIMFVIVAILLIIVLLYVIKIVSNLHKIITTVQKKTAELSNTLGDVEEYIKNSRPMNFLSLLFNRKKKSKDRVVK